MSINYQIAKLAPQAQILGFIIARDVLGNGDLRKIIQKRVLFRRCFSQVYFLWKSFQSMSVTRCDGCLKKLPKNVSQTWVKNKLDFFSFFPFSLASPSKVFQSHKTGFKHILVGVSPMRSPKNSKTIPPAIVE